MAEFVGMLLLISPPRSYHFTLFVCRRVGIFSAGQLRFVIHRILYTYNMFYRSIYMSQYAHLTPRIPVLCAVSPGSSKLLFP